MHYRRPRAFLSYRHQERQGGPQAQRYNEQHRAWVSEFAQALASWNVDVIHDGRLQTMFRPLTAGDPGNVAFLAEVSLLCIHVSQTFLPIVTRGYLERVSPVGFSDQRKHGTVSEEWDLARECHAAGQIQWTAIIRQWPIESLSYPPQPILQEDSWDYRFVAAERDEVELLADQLHAVYEVERPAIDLPFDEWIPLYVKWCMLMQSVSPEEGRVLGAHVLKALVDDPSPPPQWPNVDDWPCDYQRPRRFLAHCFQLVEAGAFFGAAVGSGRHDADELSKLLQAAGAQTVYDHYPGPPLDHDQEHEQDEQAKQLVTSAVSKHLTSFKRPMLFDASVEQSGDGLYFGPTKLEYSHRHPIDIEHLQRASQPKTGFFGRLMGIFKG